MGERNLLLLILPNYPQEMGLKENPSCVTSLLLELVLGHNHLEPLHIGAQRIPTGHR